MENSTISDLRCKEVINICDGARMGYVEDIHIDLCSGRVTALVVPGERKLKDVFKKREDIVIPWAAVKNIGDDIVLVEAPVCAPSEKIRIWHGKP